MKALRERLGVVVLTHNRVQELARTLTQLLALPEQPQIVVVDNASPDATREMVIHDFPQVRLLALARNIGAAARNAGVAALETDYVAFCDDDTWWDAGMLEKAADLLDAYPQVAILSARVLVGPEQREDPACGVMAASPLPSAGLPGPALLGFLAGAAVVRRSAFLQVGGYEPRFFLGGEEALLTLDLVMHGWRVVYAAQLTVHHYPSPARDSAGRRHCLVRNALWVAWMRLSFGGALRETLRISRRTCSRGLFLAAFVEALRGLPWVWRRRRVLPSDLQGYFLSLR